MITFYWEEEWEGEVSGEGKSTQSLLAILHFRVSCRLTSEMDNTDNESHKTLAAIADD